MGVPGERKNPENQPSSYGLLRSSLYGLFQHNVQRTGSIDAENISDRPFLGHFCLCNAV